MLSKNIPGGIIICLIVFTFVGIGLSMGIHINWPFYFKMAGVIAIIALVVSAITNTVPSGKE